MRKIFTITVIALLGPAAFAAGEIYRWKDAGGIWHYTDQPRLGAELVRRTNSPAAATPAPATAPATATAPVTAAPAPVPGSDALPVSEELVQQVRDEAATAKTQQCEKLKVTYDSYVQAQAIHKTDETGKRVYMTAAEIDAARIQARAARDLACGN